MTKGGRYVRGTRFDDGSWLQCGPVVPACMGRAVYFEASYCTCADPPIKGLCGRYYGDAANEAP